MHHTVSLSITKIALLTSLLFISNVAYAQEQQNGWKHGFGVHSLKINEEQQGLHRSSAANQLLVEYVARIDWDKWSLYLGVGTGISSSSFDITNVASNARLRFDYNSDYVANVAVFYRISSKFSLGPTISHYAYTVSGNGTNDSETETETGLALSVHSQNRKHAFEITLAEDSSTLGYRWFR